jgi:hypothetical protein
VAEVAHVVRYEPNGMHSNRNLTGELFVLSRGTGSLSFRAGES